MYLEKLEIQGFKSFATKNTLIFPGLIDGDRRGLTAVVGPNGSGKSNIADAVRWALGEQSMKTLRGKKSEDVIFSGSDKKGKLGMAEVSLFLNNSDGKVAIDYSELVLTRRLYRDGESEYLINNAKARLIDVQILLAKANVGQKTYSVIGQGMVEGFLNTSLSERKEFFDEATGVKQFQIKRDDSLNKLRASLEHLGQAEMLLGEIEPRLAHLTRQVGRLKKRGEVEVELREFQLVYYRTVWHEINDRFKNANEKLLDLEKVKAAKDKKLASLNTELVALQRQAGVSQEFDRLQAELSAKQSEKEKAMAELAKIDARLELKFESEGKFDLSFFKRRATELEREEARLQNEISSLEKSVTDNQQEVKKLETEKNRLTKEIEHLHQSLGQESGSQSDGRIDDLKKRLKKSLDLLETAEQLDDISGIKISMKEIRQELTELHTLATNLGLSLSKQTQTSLLTLTQQKEGILEQLRLSSQALTIAEERLRLATSSLNEVHKEKTLTTGKLKAEGSGSTSAERKSVEVIVENLDTQLKKIKDQLGRFTSDQEDQRQKLFSLQNENQHLQIEVNRLTSELNDSKIESARQETKLEDLEVEIRQNLGGLKEVRDNRQKDAIDRFAVQEKITQLKRQLDLIGGIDPEIESEYITTKERHDFLSNQVNDLLSTGASLEKVIEELDGTIKERFDKEFKVISQKFEEYFKILFSGGVAKIIKVMTDEENEEIVSAKNTGVAVKSDESNESITVVGQKLKRIKFLQKYNATGLAGIEIQATPPGKKIKSIAMLSGGERALTAIALICAIISANPSPFVMLDEVDAALDEANSERLAKILDDLSHKTQFIVITHNRASMLRAAVLYGVAMQDDGVSKLLSIKLEDAKARS
jgi:chromosome segregation protein